MASADKELEEQLLEAGNKLVDPPSSVDELLHLLDLVESCLSRVEQSPTISMQSALSPSLKALIADKLLRHSDVDVKVAVASCITEITRITAPDAPYDDDQMKEVFQLVVSSFENLYDKSSRSYAKRISILETVAKVRSCVVMLDLECDALILEMFRHFFKAVSEHHPENVFSSMETIMTLVLEESEDISLELLSPILASVKKDNEEILPNVQKLGERVLESCAAKLKPYLVQAVDSLGFSLDDYSKVLASICQETSSSLEQNDVCATSEHAADGSKSAKATLEESMQVIEEEAKEVYPPEQVTPVDARFSKSVMSNGVVQAGEDDSLGDLKSQKKQEDVDLSDHSKGTNISGNEDPNNLDAKKVNNTERKPEQPTKRRGKQSSSSTKSAEPSEVSAVGNEKEGEKILDSKSHSKDIPSSPHEDHSVEVAGPSENDREIDAKISSRKAGNDESEVVASPTPSESIPDENCSKKTGRAKKKDKSAKEVAISIKDVSKEVLEGTSDSDAKLSKRSAKKAPGRSSDGKKTTMVDSIKKTSGSTSDPEGKKQSAKKEDESNKGGRSSSRQLEDKRMRKRGKLFETVVLKFAKDEDKEIVSSPKLGTMTKDEQHLEETPKTNLKRKRTPGKENSDVKEYGENLVGSRVKVWWPKDRMFYEGIVDSFDYAKKKHKVMYDDGDEEILNLKRERWEFIEVDSDSDGEEGSDHAVPDASADMPPYKKGKTSAGESTKRRKMDASSKGSEGATSSKSKGASTKSGHKSNDGSKIDSKSKDSKSVGKSEDEVSRKSRDQTSKSGTSKSVDAAPKMSKSKNIDTPKTSKSKNDDVSTPKPSAKSKQETPKTGKSKQETPKTGKSKQEISNAAASKGKSPKSGGKSNVNISGKGKSGSSKTKDTENENLADLTKGVEDTKGKTSSSTKAQGSETKSGKKRRRG